MINDKHDEQENPLLPLFLDRSEVIDKAELAKALTLYIRLIGDTKKIVPLKAWDGLNLQQKVLLFMLGKIALRLSGIITIDEEKMSSSEIGSETKIKPNSVRPTMSRLVESGLVSLDEEINKYYIPDYLVWRAIESLKTD